ncbi:hypothetical protein MYAM1_001321 [Malassezia yamatoensis]|uniref:Protein YAE1 n=1 Tax=Malassezia yamatoensis TaxID=253288 RepID=A0AAJ6CI94_9BASI|nr:hypothetical protein MYAM1_001321 [Malassezia yamatoensis]
MGTRAWTGYEQDDNHDYSGFHPSQRNATNSSPSSSFQKLDETNLGISLASVPLKSFSLDQKATSTNWDKATSPAPRHHTYPLPRSERESPWTQPSGPPARDNSYSSSNLGESPQSRPMFDHPLGVSPSQERLLGNSSAFPHSLDGNTPSPRLAWERNWPSNASGRNFISPSADFPSTSLVAPIPPQLRSSVKPATVVYPMNDMRLADAVTLSGAPYPPSGVNWVPPENYTETGGVPAVSSWTARPIAGATRRSDGNTAHHDRANQEISTLFIAGFPDDITVREFANMFLFAKGFEASMLKFPSPQPPRGGNSLDDSTDKSHANDIHENNSTAQDSSATRNKQIIGFAKFYTREEASEAREILNGFRIDPDRGCILKAELAKKNLHTKRSAPFVVNKHHAMNAHTAASRTGPSDPPLIVADSQVPYAAMMNSTALATHSNPYPVPLNMASIADGSREAAALQSAMPQSAPPRMDAMLSSWPSWPTGPNGYDMRVVPSNETPAYPRSVSPGSASSFDMLRASLPTKLPPTGADSLPRRPDTNVLQGGMATPQRQDPADLRGAARDGSMNEASSDHFLKPDSAGSFGRMQPGSDSNTASDRAGGKESMPQSNIHDNRTDPNDPSLNSLLSSFPRRRSPAPMDSNPHHADEIPRDSHRSNSAQDSAADVPASSQSKESAKDHSTLNPDLSDDTSDSLSILEQAAYSSGYQAGSQQGQHLGAGEGRDLGREKGFELWEELGYYMGVVRIWSEWLASEPTSDRKTQKQKQHLTSLQSLLDQMPSWNDSSLLHQDPGPNPSKTPIDSEDTEQDLSRLLERIRARFRLLCSSTGMPSYTGLTTVDNTNPPTTSTEAPKASYSRLGGKMVDVNQLQY